MLQFWGANCAQELINNSLSRRFTESWEFFSKALAPTFSKVYHSLSVEYLMTLNWVSTVSGAGAESFRPITERSFRQRDWRPHWALLRSYCITVPRELAILNTIGVMVLQFYLWSGNEDNHCVDKSWGEGGGIHRQLRAYIHSAFPIFNTKIFSLGHG